MNEFNSDVYNQFVCTFRLFLLYFGDLWIDNF